MILVDERVGSREQLSIIRGLGVDAELAGKLSADFQFTGNGEDGPVLIGIERKTIQDLLNSMRDRRLAGSQVSPMILTYDVRYLVVEGIWRRGRGSGLVEVPSGSREWKPARGNVRYSEVDRFLCSIEEQAVVRLWRTADEEETCAAIVDRFLWWDKQWDEHKTAQTLYVAGLDTRPKGRKPLMFRGEATLVEKWLHALPGIDGRALDLAKHFASGREIANRSVDGWLKIKGLRIGKPTAEKIVAAIARTTHAL